MKIVFTKHAEDRMKKRKITEDEVVNTINFSDKTYKRQDNFYAHKNIGRATIEVVYEKDKYINVITVYYI